MKLAVLPFNAAEGTLPGLGRQIANFVGETVRTSSGAEIHQVNYSVPVDEESGRIAFVSISTELMEQAWIEQFFEQTEADRVVDGWLKIDGETISWAYRCHERGKPEPIVNATDSFPRSEVLPKLHGLIKWIAEMAEAKLADDIAGDSMDLGTDKPETFLKFLEGYDGFYYVQQAQGRVAAEYSPEPALNVLLEAAQEDTDFLAPYETILQLCRACAHFRIGTLEMLESVLVKLTELAPKDFRAFFVLGELYQGVNEPAKAATYFEKAIALEPDDSGLYTRLGIVQLAMGMPVNAERNFRRAADMEVDEKPALDYLATVLIQTNRAHEIPALWKAELERNPLDSKAHAKYAVALFQTDRKDEGRQAFEAALDVLTDALLIKRYYAPVLAAEGEFDRAMDFFEDCLEESPNDVPLLLEYAQTLQAADRAFEVPRVLKDVLASNPDANTRAQTLAWMIELEQPKRVETVESARAKMEAGDFEGAVRELKPLRNWLADYWKLWALLSAAYNRLEQSEDAEDAARKLLDLFPGCEPAYGEMVNALSKQGRQEEAYSLMRFAAANMPGSLPVHLNLALAAKRAGHEDEARHLARQIREAVGANEELEPFLTEIEA